MKKVLITLAVVCYLMALACLVLIIVGACFNAKITAITSLSLSMIASLVNGVLFTLYAKEKL